MEAFNGIIREYNKQLVASSNPRDFNADLPILQALGVKNYDQTQDLNELQVILEEALKKFVKDWKTVDKSRLNYLMKYGIVQEVMKIEERKAIRMLAAAKPTEKTPPKDEKPTSMFDKKGIKSPRGGKNNKDLATVSGKKLNQYGIYRPPQKIFLDALPDETKTRKTKLRRKTCTILKLQISPKVQRKRLVPPLLTVAP